MLILVCNKQYKNRPKINIKYTIWGKFNYQDKILKSGGLHLKIFGWASGLLEVMET